MYKVIILGDSSVGKTYLFERWNKNEVPAETKATVTTGFASKTFKVDSDTIRVQFWDTAGQGDLRWIHELINSERYRAMTRQYYNGANGAVIVYSIADSATFTSVADWLKDLITSLSDDIPIMLVGNKLDLDKKDMRQGNIAFYCRDLPV